MNRSKDMRLLAGRVETALTGAGSVGTWESPWEQQSQSQGLSWCPSVSSRPYPRHEALYLDVAVDNPRQGRSLRWDISVIASVHTDDHHVPQERLFRSGDRRCAAPAHPAPTRTTSSAYLLILVSVIRKAPSGTSCRHRSIASASAQSPQRDAVPRASGSPRCPSARNCVRVHRHR